MLWAIAEDSELSRYFEGESVWSKKWDKISSAQVILTDHRGEPIRLSVWEASFNGICKKFAADEVSNGVWIFALPQRSVST